MNPAKSQLMLSSDLPKDSLAALGPEIEGTKGTSPKMKEWIHNWTTNVKHKDLTIKEKESYL